ncbi:glycosyltransferase [Brachyspira murdochii]|uniref:Glycosyl transferase family 2 n=1 Tax=Brachyspira murdochii (strain ATCC 51284 / DSM 12563 / 56-150) TaxID=526224 RepID=D5U4J5_BRAM5|nr:glycosyltransferase [Brachyspira murdochii]ADG70240.1 glycosyl transferase family 2 [Brachyspira murdochii DSM 12563]
MKSNPLISIIIPVYNGENYIKDAINSALNQTYRNIEVIVVDDGSKDDTANIVKSFRDKITYIYKNNGGVASALNYAIKEAKGDYISWLSHDDIYYPNKIEEEVNELENIDDKTVIYSGFEFVNEKLELITVFENSYKTEYRRLNNNFYSILLSDIGGCTLLIPKEVFSNVGFFNENLLCVQDYDFWFRMFKHGYKVKYIPKVLLQYRIHKKQDSNSKKDLLRNEGNKLWINMLKNINDDEYQSIFFNRYNVLNKIKNRMQNSIYDKLIDFINTELKTYKEDNKQYYSNNNKISIIINIYNRDCNNINLIINSIIEQNYNNIEIIFITNNKLNIDFNIEYKIFNPEKDNNILDIIDGNFIQFINNNEILIKDKLHSQFNEFIEAPSIDISYSNYYFDKDNNKIYPKLDSLSFNEDKQFEDMIYFWNNPIYIPLCSMLIKRKVFEKINMTYNNDYNTIMQLSFYGKMKFINKYFFYYTDDFQNTNYYIKVQNEINNNKYIIDRFKDYILLDNFYLYRSNFLKEYSLKNLDKKSAFHLLKIEFNVSYLYIYIFNIRITLKRSKNFFYRIFLFLYALLNKNRKNK